MSDHELVLTRVIDAPPEKLFRAWTEPDLITQWFTPPPWKTVRAETDVRPGGASLILTFEDLGGGKSRYTARARHWTKEDRDAHEKMGFHQGWSIATDQLAALVARI